MKRHTSKITWAIFAAVALLTGLGTESFAGGPLYQITSGGAFNPATDKVVTIRNGGGVNNPDVQTTLGTAATHPTSDFLSSTGTIPSSSLPTPAASALGGVQAATPTANQFLTGIGTDGVPTKAQPSFANISGSVGAGQLPNPTSSALGGVQAASPTANQFMTGISSSGVPTKAQPAFTDISGTVAAGQLPNPSASTLGGVQSATATANQFLTGISTLGVPTKAQPAFADISGTASVAQGGTGVTAAQGNGTKVQLSTGTTTTNNCVKFDANGNTVDAGAPCGSGGSVSVTASTPDVVVNPSPGTGTFTIGTTSPLDALGTATTTAIVTGDMGKTVTHSATASVANSLPGAGTTGFGQGSSYTEVNLGSGVVTTTAGAGTINGASTAKLHKYGFSFNISDAANSNWFSLGFPGYDTITSGAMVKFSADTSGAFTAASAGTDYQAPIILTTTGTSGAATLTASGTSSVLNIPQYTGGGGGSGTVNSGNTGQFALYTATGTAVSGTSDLTDTGTLNHNVASIVTVNGAASTPPLLFNGSLFTGGTGTTTLPHILFQPTGTTASTTWATGGTWLGVNAASGFNGDFFCFGINGASCVIKGSATGNVTLGTAASYIISGRSKLSSPADGKWLMQNNAATGFTMLQGGGSTSSFPGWKVSGATWQARLADD